MPGEASDEDLMHLVAGGNEAALRELMARYATPLRRFVVRHGVERDADDLCQEAWLRVARSAARFDRARRFSTWLFQITVNLCRDWHRRRHDEPIGDGAEWGASRGGEVGASPLEGRDVGATAATEAGLDARRLLAALPEAQRSVLLLRYYHGFSEAEAAEILGCPRGTVKSRLHQAVARLLSLERADPQPGGRRREPDRP
ncbi:MAG TPA: RNA polymerase sigma factor [Candidatus Bathyarchaeia archaeon]|nr:RNA polymerase sigma factor [Candidatus Bathyarchaeia archaeon]